VGSGTFLLAALLAADLSARLDAGMETGAQAGTRPVGDLDSGTSHTLELDPSLAAVLASRGLDLQTRYAPRLFFGDAITGQLVGVRHSADLAGSWRQSSVLDWKVSEQFRYGRNEFAWDPGSTRPFDFLESLLPVISDDLFTDTELGFTLVPERNLALNVSAGYVAYGGVSAASQQLIPLQHGPQLYAGLYQELSRTDRLSTELYGSHSVATGNRLSSLMKLNESWQRQLATATQASLTLGASAYRKESPGEETSLGLFPVAGASLEHDVLERTQRLELKALAALGPRQNPLTADLVERAELAISARWVLRDRLSIRGRAAAARELGLSSQATRLALGALDVAYRLRPDISFSAGAEAIWQQVPSQQTAAVLRWIAFTALSFTARSIL
jgi:hypothetical protein